MSVIRATFTDPITAATYVWPINPPPDGVSAQQKQRVIDRTSNTGNVGTVKQQGDDGAYIIHWEPKVFLASHEQALWEWFVKSKKQTIYLTDFNNEQYEGQIITLARQQIGAMGGPGDIPQRLFYCKYVFEFEVYRFISGVMADAGVTP